MTDHIPEKDSHSPEEVDASPETDQGPEALRSTDSFDQREGMDDSLIGATVGHYHIRTKIGQGGFGRVYKARDVKLNRDAALKFLSAPKEDIHMKLFEREAKVIAALGEHSSIVTIYSWGEYKGEYYFALEYMEGSASDLVKKSARKGLPVKDAVRITLKCADALAFAHGRRILHRDIKPANILVRGNGKQVKLCDFGLARFRPAGDVTMTLSGTASGSPPYMSPEQARFETLDERSDIYSLGVTFYELLSGRLPVQGSTVTETLEGIRRDEGVPLRKIRPELPAPVLSIVEKATAFRINERYASAKELVADLQRALDELNASSDAETTLAPPDPETVLAPDTEDRLTTTEKPKHNIRRAVFATVAAILVALSLIFFRQSKESSLFPQALAEARMALDNRESAAAEILCSEYLIEHPDDPQALYFQGYARILDGRYEEASSSFQSVRDEPMRIDGEAAVAFQVEGEAARAQIVEAGDLASSDYPRLLLAILDLSQENFETAREILEGLEKGRLPFRWQEHDRLQSLGQVYFKLGEFAQAKAIFDRLEKADGLRDNAVARAFTELVRSQLDVERRAEVSEQIARVKQLLPEPGAADSMDTWTSRPLRVWLPPATVGNGRIARETGLADVLPWLLGEALGGDANVPIEIVERKMLANILSEQALSAQLSSEKDALRLGRVLGANLIISCSFGELFNDEFMKLKIVETESTGLIPLERHALHRRMNPDEWVEEVAKSVRNAVGKEIAVRGILTNSDDSLQINVGSLVGVRDGMRFEVMSAKGRNYLMPGVTALVTNVVDGTHAMVELDGLTSSDVPEGGLYVEAKRTESHASTRG